MKYKNIDCTIEDVSLFVPAKELYKQTFKSPIEFNSYKNDYERVIMFRLFKWRLVVSINRLVELADAGLYDLDTNIREKSENSKKITNLK
tara:strand:+ start:683 stop:952 length:270 start_codon:yes stop_codon:yes gene_type:complete